MTRSFEGEWRAVQGIQIFRVAPVFIRRTGLRKQEDARGTHRDFKGGGACCRQSVASIERKKEKKNPPLLI